MKGYVDLGTVAPIDLHEWLRKRGLRVVRGFWRAGEFVLIVEKVR